MKGWPAPWRVAVALALLLLLQAGGDTLHLVLRYERGLLPHQPWRLFTAHFVHLGWAHALLNAAGVLLCCALAPALFRQPLALLRRLAWLALGTSLLLWIASPGVQHYVGLSGVLYGLFVLGLWPQARQRDPLAVAALLLLGGWVAWQLVAGPAAAEEQLIGGRIVAVAHAWGVLAALAWLLACRVCVRRRGPASAP